jgi:hypothetical protein
VPLPEGRERMLAAMPAWPESQKLLSGATDRLVGTLDVGWYDQRAMLEGDWAVPRVGRIPGGDPAGAFALVRTGGPFADLAGQVLRVTRKGVAPYGGRRAFVVVARSGNVEAELALARRAFLALGVLTHATLACTVEVLREVAARRKYPSVHEQRLELALEARREGLPFEEFWQRAMRPRNPALTWRGASEPRPAHCRLEGEWPPRGAVRFPNDTFDRQIALDIHGDEASAGELAAGV